jgi:diaminopimelate decarboxylase
MIDGSRVAGIEAAALADEYGTPLYVYDLDAVAARVAALRAAMPGGFELAYAVKANPALAVLAEMARLGVGADVASGGELAAALRAGIDPSRIVLTGPGKRDEELAAAARARLRAVTVESPAELGRLERQAEEAGAVVPILLRVAVDAGEAEETPILSAGWRKFGIDPSELEPVARRADASSRLDLLGLHAFGASNVRDPDVIAGHVSRTIELARSLTERVGFSLRLVDAGGGLGIPYAGDEAPLDLDRLRDLLAPLAGIGPTVVLEPGRYLVGPCGVLLTRVLDVKRVGGRAVAVVDTGIHHALRPALVGRGHRLRLLADRPRAEPVLVAGPLCTGLDVLPDTLDRVPAPGDLVALLDLGAYGFTESMPLFLSHPTPAEVAIGGGRSALIRPRVDPSRLLDEQSLASWQLAADAPKSDAAP